MTSNQSPALASVASSYLIQAAFPNAASPYTFDSPSLLIVFVYFELKFLFEL